MTKQASRRWYQRIGPGLITACVVIGPGSIMTSSKVGANDGYTMLWVVVISVAFMTLYMSLGAKLGVVSDASPGDLLRRKAGSWLAVLVGLSVFFIASAFQSGNNIGAAAAFEAFVDSKHIVTVLIIGLNAIAIGFLFAFKDLYKWLERVMATFVAIMLISFAINLFCLRPNPVEMAKGLIPSLGQSGEVLPVVGLIGTTFVIAGAFYQAYLVRQKGWGIDDLKYGLVDVRISSLIMFAITLMLMSTAAAALYTGEPVKLTDPVAVADSLKTTFGPSAKIIFCIGLFSAAYSSFLINSMIGGFMAADGLGLGSDPRLLGPRLLTTAALVIGAIVGIATVQFDFDRTPTIIAAQAVTVVVAPLVAGVLLWLTSSRDVMGEKVNRPFTIALGFVGFLMLLTIAGKTAFLDLPKSVRNYVEADSTK